jgi:excisionase family DNA binding protein
MVVFSTLKLCNAFYATFRNMESEHPFLTVAEYAELMRLTPTTIRRLVGSGQVDAVKVGRQYRIPYPVIVASVRSEVAE